MILQQQKRHPLEVLDPLTVLDPLKFQLLRLLQVQVVPIVAAMAAVFPNARNIAMRLEVTIAIVALITAGFEIFRYACSPFFSRWSKWGCNAEYVQSKNLNKQETKFMGGRGWEEAHTGCNFVGFLPGKGSHSLVFRSAWVMDGARHDYLDFDGGRPFFDNDTNSRLFECRFAAVDTLDDRRQHPGYCWESKRVHEDVRNLVQPLPDCGVAGDRGGSLMRTHVAVTAGELGPMLIGRVEPVHSGLMNHGCNCIHGWQGGVLRESGRVALPAVTWVTSFGCWDFQ